MSQDPTEIAVGYDRIWFRLPWSRKKEELVGADDHRLVRPFLKWTGGKQWLAPFASQWLTNDFDGRYYEPFLGGASSFLAANPSSATLSDRSVELITTYQAVRDEVELVIELLKGYPHNKRFYEDLRRKQPRKAHTQAARMIYLNKTAFNGIYRVNRAGRFNVPFGDYKNPTICNEERLRAVSKRLANVDLRVGDFAEVLAGVSAGDFVYLDPPYITGHQNNGFLKYNALLFSWEDQIRLAALARELTERGATVVVSNSDHPAVLDLYPGFFYYRLSRPSRIGGAVASRGSVAEAVLASKELGGIQTGCRGG
jgi:DNA adenine methylase